MFVPPPPRPHPSIFAIGITHYASTVTIPFGSVFYVLFKQNILTDSFFTQKNKSSFIRNWKNIYSQRNTVVLASRLENIKILLYFFSTEFWIIHKKSSIVWLEQKELINVNSFLHFTKKSFPTFYLDAHMKKKIRKFIFNHSFGQPCYFFAFIKNLFTDPSSNNS